MSETLAELETRLDAVTTRLMPPLRAEKRLDVAALADLLSLGDELASSVAQSPQVPTPLVGKCLFVFTAMLAEADHASEPDAILDAAWAWQERLRRMFGPQL